MTSDVNALPGRHIPRALLALACATLLAPASALAAGTGGGGLGGSGGTSGGTGTTTTTTTATTATAPTTSPVSVTGDGITLHTVASTIARQQLTFAGTASGAAGDTVEIERQRSGVAAAPWTPTVTATVAAGGAFSAEWNALPGQFAVRAIVLRGNARRPLASAAAATPALTVTVYQGSRATIYGPGFYGRRTACGQKLTPTTIGVANRTLPCGSEVSVLYGGRLLTVPVIDRGPFANGASWDLTMATASALGIPGTVHIGTVTVSRGSGTTTAPTTTSGSTLVGASLSSAHR